MSCQRQILEVRWNDHVRNSDVAVQTGLPNINETIIKRRHMLFGHVAGFDATTPAHQILKQVIAVKSGYQPDAVWRRAPGRPRNSWIMQIGNGSPLSIRREWKKAQDHGHHGESSQRTSARSRHDDDDECLSMQHASIPRVQPHCTQFTYQTFPALRHKLAVT